MRPRDPSKPRVAYMTRPSWHGKSADTARVAATLGYDGSVTKLHHIALGSPDVARLAAFYRDAFELRELTRHTFPDGRVRSIWLDVDGARLMIEHTASAARVPSAEASPVAGVFLVAFQVSPPDRPALEQRLEALGCPIEARTEFSSYARDPDGNRIAISHYPEPPP